MSFGKQRIGVLVGGITGQRDLSFRAGEAIVGALRERGHQAAAMFVDRDIDLLLRQSQIEVAFLAMQGRYGEDGCVQGLLEVLGVPYTGSGVLASALAMNRWKTKEVLRLHNVPTAPGYLFDGEADDDVLETHGGFGYPVVVRPVGDRGPLGVNVARDEQELEAAVEQALRVDDQVLVDRHLEGRAISVAVLDGSPLGALEVLRGGAPGGGWGSQPRVEAGAPARLSPERHRALLRLAVLAYEALGCDGLACVDLVVSERGNEIVLDIDPMPSLLPGALVPRIAQGVGMAYGELCERMLQGARLRAHGQKRNRRLVQRTFEGPERRAGFATTAH